MRELAIAEDFSFPYLYDESQAVARAYHAACTPDFFVFDENLACAYRGRFDAATPGNQAVVTGAELIAALDHILADQPVSADQKPSIGCNIKWAIKLLFFGFLGSKLKTRKMSIAKCLWL